MSKLVNAIGDACPIPVVKTKNAIKEMGSAGGVVETLVDNEIAVQNLTKMANQKGYEVASEKVSDGQFKVTMTIPAGAVADSADAAAEAEVCIPDTRKKNTVVVITSDAMGSGDDELGKLLIKGFVYAVSQQDELPETIIFYNGGAKLTVEGASTLEDLKSLEAQGVKIMTCGTCLKHYGLMETHAVGVVSNMYEIVETMNNATLIIRP